MKTFGDVAIVSIACVGFLLIGIFGGLQYGHQKALSECFDAMTAYEPPYECDCVYDDQEIMKTSDSQTDEGESLASMIETFGVEYAVNLLSVSGFYNAVAEVNAPKTARGGLIKANYNYSLSIMQSYIIRLEEGF
jgi:hypothetical protein